MELGGAVSALVEMHLCEILIYGFGKKVLDIVLQLYLFANIA